jgi:hypothetical protein
LGEGGRVDLVVLQPGGGDGLAAQRVHQVGLEAVVLQQLHQPAPAVGGLEGDRRADRQIPDHAEHRADPIGYVAVDTHRAVLLDHSDLRPLAVDVDSDVDRH